MKIYTIILTLNEEKHLERCLLSIKKLKSEIFIVDSFSNDKTETIAKKYQAKFLKRKFINQADQFNWALKQVPINADWIFKLDADEIASPDLIQNIKSNIYKVDKSTNALMFKRYISFQGKIIKYGGSSPINIVRFFRSGFGNSEERWMDEHIKITGNVKRIDGYLIDDNLNPLSWWIDKHNNYSGREVIDILNSKNIHKNISNNDNSGKVFGFKRFLKEKIYKNFPLGFRAFIYFIYRYFFRLGFLDGKLGFTFHFLQGFWYRYLVDAKLREVMRYMKINDVNEKKAIKEILGYDVF